MIQRVEGGGEGMEGTYGKGWGCKGRGGREGQES